MAFTRLFPSVGADATAANGLGFKLNDDGGADLLRGDEGRDRLYGEADKDMNEEEWRIAA